MFGYRYVKASPSTYVIQYKNGKAVREGTGLTFWYFATQDARATPGERWRFIIAVMEAAGECVEGWRQHPERAVGLRPFTDTLDRYPAP